MAEAFASIALGEEQSLALFALPSSGWCRNWMNQDARWLSSVMWCHLMPMGLTCLWKFSLF